MFEGVADGLAGQQSTGDGCFEVQCHGLDFGRYLDAFMPQGLAQFAEQQLKAVAEIDRGEIMRLVEHLMDEGHGPYPRLRIARRRVRVSPPPMASACRSSRLCTSCRLFFMRW